MNLYDEVIKSWGDLIGNHPLQNFQVNSEEKWPDIGKRNMVLSSDMAFELGGSIKPLTAVGGTAITSNRDLVSKDEILLLGKDLTQITKETPYARLSICLVDDAELGEGEELFKTVKNIDYTRYHINPEGFMMRVSAAQKRESVRLSKDAITKGISFSNVGNLMLNSYHKNPKIKAVKIIFIDEETFDFKAIAESVKKCDMITQTIDHISLGALMDCNTCGLQKVCDEVEGMRELHFKNKTE